MSTRSVIAYPHADGWSGVCCHSDGYPTWTGPEIWTVLRYRHNNDVSAFVEAEIKAHPGGWSQFGDRCYCHGPEVEGEAHDMRYDFTDEATNAALFIEWVYVVGRHAITIYTSVRREGTYREEYAHLRSGYYDAPSYGWGRVGQVSVHGEEPDWQEIETRGRHMRELAYRLYDTEDKAS